MSFTESESLMNFSLLLKNTLQAKSKLSISSQVKSTMFRTVGAKTPKKYFAWILFKQTEPVTVIENCQFPSRNCIGLISICMLSFYT
jgi:hypothetical protein